MMKKIYIFGSLMAAMSLVSCDNIAPEDRYIDVERNHSEKVVLLEEFTGQRCVNCPDAAEIVEQLHHAHPDNFIAVGMHPSASGFTQPLGPVNLRCEAADVYFNAFGKPQEFPTAIIDRTQFNGSLLLNNKQLWASYVEQELAKETPVDIAMESAYNVETRELTINYGVEYTSVVDYGVSFQLWIIENKIIAPQYIHGEPGINREYEHNHVLRDAINGFWGVELGNDFVPTDKTEGSATYVVNEKWVPENCQVVGFVYRNSDKVVLQAHILDVMKSEVEE